MPVTIREVADAAGVSIATVSRVLNNTPHHVSEGTRQRILTVADEMGYRPNLAARSLRTERSSTIGIITDNIDSPHTTMMIRGIQDRVKEEGYICVVISADWDPKNEREAIHDLASRSIDGIIFAETWHRSANEILELNEMLTYGLKPKPKRKPRIKAPSGPATWRKGPKPQSLLDLEKAEAEAEAAERAASERQHKPSEEPDEPTD